MGKLIFGVLREGGWETKIDMQKAMSAAFAGPEWAVVLRILLDALTAGCAEISGWDVTEKIGLQNQDHDYYAAAIATQYGLPGVLYLNYYNWYLGVFILLFPDYLQDEVAKLAEATALPISMEFWDVIGAATIGARAEFSRSLPIGTPKYCDGGSKKCVGDWQCPGGGMYAA
jgi:hypothetical protein